MSGIEIADMHQHTLDQGQMQLTKVRVGETFLYFPTLQVLDPLSFRFLVEQPSVVQKHGITPTESAALAYDLNRARFAGPKTVRNSFHRHYYSRST